MQIHRLMGGGLTKYVVEMSSGAMIYIPSFVKIDSGILNLIRWIYRYTDSLDIA
jgi:hypothetical protein